MTLDLPPAAAPVVAGRNGGKATKALAGAFATVTLCTLATGALVLLACVETTGAGLTAAGLAGAGAGLLAMLVPLAATLVEAAGVAA